MWGPSTGLVSDACTRVRPAQPPELVLVWLVCPAELLLRSAEIDSILRGREFAMRTRDWGLALGAAMVLAAVAPSPALASPVTTYQGTWHEATAPDCAQTPVSGRWSVTLKKDGTANVSLAIFMDGTLHAAWGGNGLGERFTWVQTGDGYTLTRSDWVFEIDGDDVRFEIPDRYPSCDGYALGTVTR